MTFHLVGKPARRGVPHRNRERLRRNNAAVK
jgi:hypothetical protein